MKPNKHPKPQRRVYPEELKKEAVLVLSALELLPGSRYTRHCHPEREDLAVQQVSSRRADVGQGL